MSGVYFNEFDPFAAQWLRNLYPEAHVDQRSISDVQGGDLDGFDECHFFGGIGGWKHALQLASWPAGRKVWTGSCPCQPFSICGKKKKQEDERHLWPEFLRLIEVGKPSVVFGEQVASPDGREWLTGVQADLEALGFAFGATDLCAAGVGSPHIRQRLYWVAVSLGERHNWRESAADETASQQAVTAQADRGDRWLGDYRGGGREVGVFHAGSSHAKDSVWETSVAGVPCESQRMGDPTTQRRDKERNDEDAAKWTKESSGTGSLADGELSGRVGDTPGQSRERQPGSLPGSQAEVSGQWQLDGNLYLGSEYADSGVGRVAESDSNVVSGQPSAWQQPLHERHQGSIGMDHREWSGTPDGFWRDADWIFCRDGKWRRVESGTQPLVAGFPKGVGRKKSRVGNISVSGAGNRTGRLKGYGNAIVPQLAATFIRAFLLAEEELTC